jgi:hypothetical protein
VADAEKTFLKSGRPEGPAAREDRSWLEHELGKKRAKEMLDAEGKARFEELQEQASAHKGTHPELGMYGRQITRDHNNQVMLKEMIKKDRGAVMRSGAADNALAKALRKGPTKDPLPWVANVARDARLRPGAGHKGEKLFAGRRQSANVEDQRTQERDFKKWALDMMRKSRRSRDYEEQVLEEMRRRRMEEQ